MPTYRNNREEVIQPDDCSAVLEEKRKEFSLKKEKTMIFKARYSQVFFIIALLVVVFQAGTALMAGDIVGRVTDSERGTFLQGANVQIEGTNYGAAADRFGVYRILRVPPGRYTLVATFIGYERYTVEVSAGTGDTETTQDIAMTMTSVIFDAVVVEGQREGQMKALSQQRTSPNIKNRSEER